MLIELDEQCVSSPADHHHVMMISGGKSAAMKSSRSPAPSIREVNVIVVNGGSVREDPCEVGEETAVPVIENDVRIVRFWLTSDMLEEFIHGFLVSEGLASSSPAAVVGVDPGPGTIKVKAEGDTLRVLAFEVRSSACTGIARKIDACCVPLPDGLEVDIHHLFLAAGLINEYALLWKRTGGTRRTVIPDASGGVISSTEDMLRHTSVDKAVGSALLGGSDLSSAILVCSGRLPSGMMAKACRTGIPFVISNIAPVVAGIRLAERLNTTLVEFARPPRLTIYSHPERVHMGGARISSVAQRAVEPGSPAQEAL